MLSHAKDLLKGVEPFEIPPLSPPTKLVVLFVLRNPGSEFAIWDMANITT